MKREAAGNEVISSLQDAKEKIASLVTFFTTCRWPGVAGDCVVLFERVCEVCDKENSDNTHQREGRGNA